MKLFNFQSGQLEEIPSEYVVRAILSKRYGTSRKKRINVISPMGIKGTVQGDEAYIAFSEGYKFVTPEEIQKQKDAIEYHAPFQTALE